MAMKSPTQTRSSSENMPHPKSPSRNREVDVEAELGIHPVRRPLSIEHDVNDLGQKKRVSSVLTSPQFKEELETVVTDLLRSGDGGGHVIAKEIANILSPMHRSHSLGVGCVSPINDITGSDIGIYTKFEKLSRCKLAALYRLVDLNGWSQSIYNHISLRVTKEHEHFLINPFGLLYHEVSASKLLKITMQGELVDQGTTTFSLNKAGFVIHSAIHSARPDLKCVIHVHTPDVIAVSMMECGMLPISQEAMIVGDVSYHNYQGIVLDQKEKKLLIKHLGPNNKVMFLRNHGLVACGETVEEAYHYLYHVMLACQSQVRAMSCVKQEKLVHLDKALRSKTHDAVVNKEDQMVTGDNEIKWEVGDMMFEANMRMLDNMGYRTGYNYRNPTTIQRKFKAKSDVELPAASRSHPTNLLQDIQDGRYRLQSHPPLQSRWVNSPNQYTKVRSISEEGSAPGSGNASVNGDVSPKSKTKWRNDEGSSHGTPIRIADPNQFVPVNTDPREVAVKRKKIRGQGRYDENRPGPQSQKLEGVAPGDRRGPPHEGIMTGSKGIIQRDFHDVSVVTGPPNPFASMSGEEIKAYTAEVQVKSGKKDSETEEVVFSSETVETNETITEQVLEVVADDVIEDSAAAVEVPAPVDQPTVNGHDEPKVVQEVEAAPPIVVTQPSPPQTEDHKVKNDVKVVDTPEKEPTPPTSPTNVEKPDPKKTKKEKKSATPKKVNGGEADATPAPKVEEAVPAKPTPEIKEDPKGKQKKSKKRRSLSFLKKSKKEKE